MKTRTAHWDYNRPYHATIERLDSFRRYDQAKKSLIAVIGKQAYVKWERSLDPWTRLDYPSMVDLINKRMDSYECSCTPDGYTCQGCQNFYAAREEQSNER